MSIQWGRGLWSPTWPGLDLYRLILSHSSSVLLRCCRDGGIRLLPPVLLQRPYPKKVLGLEWERKSYKCLSGKFSRFIYKVVDVSMLTMINVIVNDVYHHLCLVRVVRVFKGTRETSIRGGNRGAGTVGDYTKYMESKQKRFYGTRNLVWHTSENTEESTSYYENSKCPLRT